MSAVTADGCDCVKVNRKQEGDPLGVAGRIFVFTPDSLLIKIILCLLRVLEA